MSDHQEHPHGNQHPIESGAPLNEAGAVCVLLHGRGSSGGDIIRLSESLTPEGTAGRIAWLAPQAAGSQWYPHRFLEPVTS